MNKKICMGVSLLTLVLQASEMDFTNVEEVGVQILSDEKRNKWYADSFAVMKEKHTLLCKNIIHELSIDSSQKTALLRLWQNLTDNCENIYLYGSYIHLLGKISLGQAALDEWNTAHKIFEELYGSIIINSFMKRLLHKEEIREVEDLYFPKITEIVYDTTHLKEDLQEEKKDIINTLHSY